MGCRTWSGGLRRLGLIALAGLGLAFASQALAKKAPAPIVISTPMGQTEARLPCNRGGSPFCELRLYQVMVGTFVDGSPEHNPISGYGPGPHTGDIKGVIQALDGIKAMGFNAVWLTPIFDSAAGSPQHRHSGEKVVNPRLDGTGYYPRDYFKVDPQYGTAQDVRDLIAAAHQRDLKIIFDGVFGHHKGNVTPSPSGLVPAASNRPADYFNSPSTYPGEVVDFNNPKSLAFYDEVARYWIDVYGIDGWRLDQAYQVPNRPMAKLVKSINQSSKDQGKLGYVVGEIWGTADRIRASLGTNEAPALPSAFDFPARYALVQILATGEDGTKGKPATTLQEGWAMGAHASYPDHAIMNLMLGNHDLVRFGDLIQRAGKGEPKSESYWARHRLAFTFMAAWSGPITTYYGEEVGAEVAGFSMRVSQNCGELQKCDDHIARNMVKLPGINAKDTEVLPKELALRAYLTELMALRKVSPALYAGARTHLYSDQHLYVDLKTLGAEKFVFVMNVSDQPRTISLAPSAVLEAELGGAQLMIGDIGVQALSSELKIDLPPLSTGIVRIQSSGAAARP
jgi:cyclomaltodextrinase